MKPKPRLLPHDYAFACEVVARGLTSGVPFASNPALIARMKEAAEIFRRIDAEGYISSQRDGDFIYFPAHPKREQPEGQ